MLKRIPKALYTVAIYAVLTRAVGFVFKIYLSRKLGAEYLGVVQIGLSVFFLLLSLSSSGVHVTVSRRVAELNAKNLQTRTVVSAGLFITITSAITVIIAVFLLLPLFPKMLSDERSIGIVLLLLPALLSSAVYGIMRAWLMANRYFDLYGLSELIEEFSKIAFTVLFLTFMTERIPLYSGVAICFTLSDYLCTAFLLACYIKKGGRFAKPEGLGPLLASGTPITATRVCTGLVGTLVSVTLPILLVGSGSTVSEATAEIGRIFGMTMPLLTAPLTVTATIAIVLTPELSALNSLGKTQLLKRRVKSALIASISIGTAATIFFLIFGIKLCELLYHDRGAGLYLFAMAIVAIPQSVNQIAVTSLNSLGMEKYTFLTFIAGSVCTIVSIFALTTRLGALSVVVATISNSTVACVCNLLVLSHRLREDTAPKAKKNEKVRVCVDKY